MKLDTEAKPDGYKAEHGFCKMTINDLLKQHPQATGVFIRRKMLCVGCPAAEFHTLEDAAKLYGYELGDLYREIGIAVAGAEAR
jgi:hybrid cluster-associated redox disulfide protein